MQTEIKDKFEHLNNTGMGHLNWKGEWIPDESPIDRAREYSLKQELIKEFLKTAEKYKGRIKDETIEEAAAEVAHRYSSGK